MKKELVNKSEIKLVGLTARTNNKNEMNPATSKSCSVYEKTPTRLYF